MLVFLIIILLGKIYGHRPNRVLWQFGFRQRIPQPCDNESILHKCDLRGRHDVDWTTRHGDYIRRWSSRHEHIARGEMAIGSLGYHDPYMVWYRSITIQFLTRTGSAMYYCIRGHT
ncbi:hypothetical protein AAG906_007518 [Vitis piasezkii]